MSTPIFSVPTSALAFGVSSPTNSTVAFSIDRRPLTDFDVGVKISYSGICHSDKHHMKNDWGDSKYPLIPGHEIIGIVTQIGSKVTTLKVDDRVAIGNMTDSCQQCINCQKSAEQYCLNDGPTWVYNSNERVDEKGGRFLKPVGAPTFGGYSSYIVAQEPFVFKLPDNLYVPEAAPLLCAGITMFYPLKHWKIGKGHKVGIAGIGGLGHLGIRFAAALGAEVVGITTSPDKAMDILQLGANDTVVMTNPAHLLKYKDYFDIIISTIPVAHDPTPYLKMLRPGQSKLHVVGNMNEFPGLKGMDFVFYGRNITSSNVGGLCDTRQLLQFCSDNQIVANVVTIAPEAANIDESIDRMVKKQIRYRTVIDFTL
jgi:uncharacterized zinc-type alcohol dehydrogenase-like protein